jgi:hypothetical protein
VHFYHSHAPAEGVGGDLAPRAASPEHDVGSETAELRAALRDTHENVRVSAVEKLLGTGDPRILPDLVNALHDQSPSVREAAASALGRLGDRSALPALRQGLKNEDEDEWVRLRISQAAAMMGSADGLPILLHLARSAEGKLVRLEALTTLLKLSGGSGPMPADPDTKESQDLIRGLERWARDGTGLRWDPSSKQFVK